MEAQWGIFRETFSKNDADFIAGIEERLFAPQGMRFRVLRKKLKKMSKKYANEAPGSVEKFPPGRATPRKNSQEELVKTVSPKQSLEKESEGFVKQAHRENVAHVQKKSPENPTRKRAEKEIPRTAKPETQKKKETEEKVETQIIKPKISINS